MGPLLFIFFMLHSQSGHCQGTLKERSVVVHPKTKSPSHSLFICFGCKAWGVLFTPPGIKPVPSMLEPRNPNHWTVREIPPAQSLRRWYLPWWWQTNQVSRSLWATEESDPGGVYTLWQKVWISIFVFWQSTPVFLPGKFHGQRSLVVHKVAKESDMTEHMPTHTTIWESITHWVARQGPAQIQQQLLHSRRCLWQLLVLLPQNHEQWPGSCFSSFLRAPLLDC